MRRLVIMTFLAVAVMAISTSCHRQQQINYARVPYDSAQHNDIATTPENAVSDDEDLLELPEVSDVDINRDIDTHEIDDYLHCRGGGQ